jgi:AcrR family transcriptional regulator
MQHVAAELGVTKMALYRYLSGKTDLIAVMAEEAIGDPPDLSGVPGGWRPKVVEFTRLLAESWRLHPWLPWITIGDRVMGPGRWAGSRVLSAPWKGPACAATSALTRPS